MQKITFKYRILLFLCLLISGLTSFAQEMMFEVPLSVQVTESTQIIEGKVISKNSFWDINHHNIYTVNTLEVYKSFKGQAHATLEIITEGGVVDMTAQITSSVLELSVGDMGVFMLHESNVPFASENNIGANRYESYSAIQGMYKYDLVENIAANPYLTFQGISQQFYERIMAETHSNFVQVSQFDVDSLIDLASQNRAESMAIMSFSPETITGGTRSVLTIEGSGFGAVRGTVLFRDANTGGGSYFTALDSQVLSWSDSQVLVQVPSRAGTGTFRVVTQFGLVSNSATSLVIPYSEINVTTSADISYPTQHVDASGNGGYIWSMFTTFFLNPEVRASFTRAFDTWRCETGINWDISPTFTTVNTIAMDNINMIRFDVGTELPNGILGRNTSYFQGCSNGTDLNWYVAELDIVFNDTTNWQFGPSTANTTQVDFQTVAVHELGHGHQLAHVINPSAIMHYSISNGTNNRALSSNDILGANDVQSRSTTTAVCGRGIMTNHACSLGIDENELTNHVSVFPNPAKNEIFIKNELHLSIDKIEMFDMTGRSVKRSNSQGTSSLFTLDTSDLSTGVYVITINIEGKSLTKKIIIE